MSRETDAEARRRRLAEALRENLKRRKARARAVREETGPPTRGAPVDPSGDAPPDAEKPEA